MKGCVLWFIICPTKLPILDQIIMLHITRPRHTYHSRSSFSRLSEHTTRWWHFCHDIRNAFNILEPVSIFYCRNNYSLVNISHTGYWIRNTRAKHISVVLIVSWLDLFVIKYWILNILNQSCLPIIGDKPCKKETGVREIQLARKGNLYTELVKSSFTLIIPCLSRGSLTLHEKWCPQQAYKKGGKGDIHNCCQKEIRR